MNTRKGYITPAGLTLEIARIIAKLEVTDAAGRVLSLAEKLAHAEGALAFALEAIGVEDAQAEVQAERAERVAYEEAAAERAYDRMDRAEYDAGIDRVGYEVRRPGCPSWAAGLTRADAIEEWRAAERVVTGHRIVRTMIDGTSGWDEEATADAAWNHEGASC
jgi:hypothetical protein